MLFSYLRLTFMAHFISANISTKCRRLSAVLGREEKHNDIIMCGDIKSAKEHIIFFGGDVQDYPEKMEAHRDNKRYIEWNLENVAQLLYKRFPHGVIFVVKPSDMLLQTFSVYKNFVDCADNGSPEHQPGYGGLEHLTKLYHNALNLASRSEWEQSCDQQSHDLHTCENNTSTPVPLSLIGFSKGCVVLNQFLYDLEDVESNLEVKQFVENIQAFYWLDGGHAGGSNTWINKDALLERFAALKCKISVLVTPYQVQDVMRKWIGKEERKFVDKLRRFGANISETKLFMDEPRSIENHFRVLESF